MFQVTCQADVQKALSEKRDLINERGYELVAAIACAWRITVCILKLKQSLCA